MKKLLLGTVGLVALGMALGMAAPAIAADLPAKAPAAVAVVDEWSGFYLGANGGYGTSKKEWDSIGFGDEALHTATGAVGGGQIGYRWQTGGWVFGLEAQGDWADLKGSSVSRVDGAGIDNSKIGGFGLFTGQIGYAWNNVLWYAKGGASATSDKYFGVTAGTVVDSASETRFGAVVGAGLEFGFSRNWSLGLEYDHIFNGDLNLAFTPPNPGSGTTRTERIQQDVDLFTVRVNYRWGGPVIAKY
jgi:outer membrane immunogenic protein